MCREQKPVFRVKTFRIGRSSPRLNVGGPKDFENSATCHRTNIVPSLSYFRTEFALTKTSIYQSLSCCFPLYRLPYFLHVGSFIIAEVIAIKAFVHSRIFKLLQ